MIHSVAAIGLLLATAPAFAAESEAVAGTRMRVDWQRMISAHNIELPRLPKNHAESLRLGNGDIELARHKDSTGVIPTGPEFGAEGRNVWVRYQFPPDPDSHL